MRTIHERALDLFDERGFDAVTIEEIAAAAEVSPSSVYRYFGTKEGLIVADEFESWSQEQVEGILDVNDPVGSMIQVVLNYEAAAEQADPGARGGKRPGVRLLRRAGTVVPGRRYPPDRAIRRGRPAPAAQHLVEAERTGQLRLRRRRIVATGFAAVVDLDR